MRSSQAEERIFDASLNGDCGLHRVHLPRLDLDRHRPAEDRQLDPHPDRVLRLLRLDDLLDLPLHPLEGAVPDLDPVALVELQLDLLADADLALALLRLLL